MLTVTEYGPFEVSCKFKYYSDYVLRIRQVPMARFDSNIQAWVFPISSLQIFDDLFKGEIFYQTPKWKLLNQPKPEVKDIIFKNNVIVPNLKIRPFKYQEFGFKFMVDRLDDLGFVLNADSCGTGKTNMSIMVSKHYIESNKANKILIIAKKSIKKQWVDEFKKFTDLDSIMDIQYIPESATKAKRHKMYANLANNSILITTYQSCLSDKDLIKQCGFDMAILDEAHIIRTVGGKINAAVKKAISNTKYKILLTGTPIMARPKDLYALVNVCDDTYFGPFKDFEKKHIVYQWKGRYVEEIGCKCLDELAEKAKAFTIRRTENEIDIELPALVYSKVTFMPDDVQVNALDHLKKTVMKLEDEYKAFSEQYESDKQKVYYDKMMIIDAKLKGLIACNQAIANDPSIIAMTQSKFIKGVFNGVIPQGYKGSDKTEYVVDLVEQILDKNQKVILFSKYERCIELLKKKIEDKLKVNVLLYHGGLNEIDRNNAIDLLMNNSNYNVILATDALAEGQSLYKINNLINYDSPDTFAIKEQRIGRIRRANSVSKHAFVYDLVTVGTIDERTLEKLEHQKLTSNSIFSLSEEESEAIRKQSN